MPTSNVTFHAPIARRFPAPKDGPEEFANVETHVLRVKAKDVPSGIPDDANPREANLNRQVYRQVEASLLGESGTGSFHLKHGGIVLIADSVEKVGEDDYKVTFADGAQQGIANGNHSYQLILRAQAEGEIPDDQWVEFKIHQGVPSASVPDLADGLNTSMQVRQESLADLRGQFEWLKTALDAQPSGADHIAWHEGDSGEYDVREVIALLMSLDPTRYAVDSPVGIENTYARVSSVFKTYLNDAERERVIKFAPIALEAMELYEYIRFSALKVYGGKFRSTNLAEKTKKTGGFTFDYLLDAAGRPLHQDVRLVKPAAIVAFTAFRSLVDVAKDGTASWRYPFPDVLAMWDQSGEELLREFYDALVGQHKYNLHYAGRSVLAYRASSRTIQVADLTKRLSAAK